MKHIRRILPWIVAESAGRMFTPHVPWALWQMNLPCADVMWRRAVAQRKRLVGG